MCLAVSSSIQPTRAPTGTDDDMAGNDKAGVLGLENGTGGTRSFSATSSQTRAIRPVLVIYGISPARMHLHGTRKTPRVAESQYLPRSLCQSCGKVTAAP